MNEVDQKVPSKAGWKKAAEHVVLCPSNTYVRLRIPDLPRMIEAGTIPQHLLDAAIGVALDPDQKPTLETITHQREFTDSMVMLSVVEPAITEADLQDIPYEDKDFITQLATRQRDLDAVGEHIAGLHKIEAFRRFRRLGEFSEDVAGL